MVFNANFPPTCRKSLTTFITYCCIEYTSLHTGFELTTLVVMGTDYTGSCKSNYHDGSSIIYCRQILGHSKMCRQLSDFNAQKNV